MKKIAKLTYSVILGAVFACGTVSCNDFLKESSQDLAKVKGWEDLDEVLLGDAYLPPAKYNDNGSNLDILHFMADEIVANDAYNSDDGYGAGYIDAMFPFFTWMADTGLDKQRRYVGGDAVYWNDLYKRINVCNMVISLIDEQPERKVGDAMEKERVKGEAYFLRAAYYFILVNLYGRPYNPATADSDLGVPVKLTEFIEDVEFERVSLNTVYSQIISDLEDAERFLEGKTRKSVYHANLTATNLLQSRVYLYMQDWSKAAGYAAKVLKAQSGLLNLATKSPGDECIYKDSPETIFSMGGYAIASAFADAESYWTGDEVPPTFLVSEEMRDLYESDDYRKTLYVGNAEQYGAPYVFRKVNGQKSGLSSYSTVSSCFLLRTPEAYLTYAEAMALDGNETEARKALDAFLATRVESHQGVTESGNGLIDLIRDERAREFLIEGHRWFDLRRYTVCQPYPWSKTITHDFHFWNNSEVSYSERYVLERNDPAYTLPIPRSIRNFQVSLGNNVRPDRQPNRIEPSEEEEDY